MKYGFSGQASKKVLNQRLLISLGIRLDANNYNSGMNNPLEQFSPRLSLSYALSDKVSLNAGAGRYFQLPAYTTLGIRGGEGALLNENTAKYIGANHYNLGTEYRFREDVLFSLEGFYKDYFQYDC